MDVVTVTANNLPPDPVDAYQAPAVLAAPVMLAPPALDVAEPVTLERAKEHLRVPFTDDDAYIRSLITAARQMAEGRLNRTIVQRRRSVAAEGWRWGYRLPKPPVISVDGIGYIDDTGAEMVLDPTLYFLAEVGEDDIPVVEMNLGDEALPDLLRGRRNPITVDYTAGYPVGQVPAPIVQWILLAIGTMYSNRESVVIGGAGVSSTPLAEDFMKWLLQPYMVYE